MSGMGNMSPHMETHSPFGGNESPFSPSHGMGGGSPRSPHGFPSSPHSSSHSPHPGVPSFGHESPHHQFGGGLGSSTSSASFAPPQQEVAESTLIINQVLELEQRMVEELANMGQAQSQLFANPVQSVYHELDANQKQCADAIEKAIQQLEELLSSTLLSTNELYRVEFLETELRLQLKQLELYYAELQQLVGHAPTKPLVFLVVIQEPFPNVAYKGQTMTPGELKLRLLKGAAVQVKSLTPVKAAMIMDSHQAGKGDLKMISNDTQLMDPQYVVQFPLTFCEGTRKNGVHLRFSMQVQVVQNGRTVEGTVESDSTKPFVVMTNQKQWEACERTLLLRDAFGDKLEVSWYQFANALQRQFVRATKQDPASPSRCLSQFDFTYVKNKFFREQPIVHQKDYDGFWNWYGKCLQVVRFQRHILQLWQSGLVYGFMTRQDVDVALSGRSPGHFVIRFSERHAGQFGIAYVGAETPWRIKHYLVQPNDTAAAKFTLPDFCRDKGQFSTILQFSLNPVTGLPQFTPHPKDHAFESYYSRRVGGDTSGSGYEPLS